MRREISKAPDVLADLIEELDLSLSQGAPLPKPWQWTTDDRVVNSK